jgi:hypothetical protein
MLPHQNPVCTSPLFHACYVPHPYHCREYDLPILKPTKYPEIIFTNFHNM